MTHPTIEIRGAREHNLKNIDVSLERGQLTVITGVSGSGKSSLAFDTILAESRRRFFYTLSHYSRQFLDLSTRPAVSSIKGLSPSIFLAQNETPPSRRASVATLTDLGELFGVMFSRFGNQLCPTHRQATSAYSPSMMTDQLIRDKNGTMVVLCAPIAEAKKGHFKSVFMSLAAKGFLRVWIDGEICDLEPIPILASDKKHTIKLIVDGLRIKPESRSRILRSVESVLSASEGYVEWYPTDSQGRLLIDQGGRYSLKGGCPVCGYSWPKLDPRYFAANSLGKCSQCAGRGVLVRPQEASQWDALSSEDEEEEEGENLGNGEQGTQLMCPDCQGTGLSPTLEAIRLFNRSIRDIHGMPLAELTDYSRNIQMDPGFSAHPAAQRVMTEIVPILERTSNIGLGYLTLARRLYTLSAGELQRLKLAGILGGRLRGVLYVLDEPSQGLHPTEVHQVAQTLLDLKKDGSTVIVVDHDEGFMRLADWIIDLGPGGGSQGGNIVAQFKPKDAKLYRKVSATARFLAEPIRKVHSRLPTRDDAADQREEKHSPQGAYFEVTGGDKQINNLKIGKCFFPMGQMSVVTGVSGAGKSSLVLDTLYPLLLQILQKQEDSSNPGVKNHQGTRLRIDGVADGFKIGKVELIDRRKIAKSGVSIPASYLDILGDLRDLFAKLPESQILGLKSRSFSLAVEGGRCKECKGRGFISLKMKFLADAKVICSLCQGQRFTSQVLSVRYQGKTLTEFLEMSLSELAEHLKNHKKIIAKVRPALDLGLGYLKVGQPTSSLSGGEAQRLKLAPFFYQGLMPAKRSTDHAVIILDEPTTGLHREDVGRLLKVLKGMVAGGTTVIAIEHHDEIIQSADWRIELGPGAAHHGGKVMFQGPRAATG